MLTLSSPAKVNLFLRILRKRSDGYHELASLFQTIDLCDTIHFQMAEVDRFICSDPSLPTDESNLITKAVNLFRRKTGIKTPFTINLIKRIPMQAGLGGGSSNAATTLWALNELTGRPVSEAQLIEWGADLGSDVSFFLSGGTAYCTGRGEVIRPLNPLPSIKLTIVKPSQGLSTPQVYGNLKADLLPKRDPEYVLERFLRNEPEYFNDLECSAFEVMPALKHLKENLQGAGFSTVLMSGSGSSFFCLGEGKVPIQNNLEHFRAKFINRNDNGWF